MDSYSGDPDPSVTLATHDQYGNLSLPLINNNKRAEWRRAAINPRARSDFIITGGKLPRETNSWANPVIQSTKRNYSRSRQRISVRKQKIIFSWRVRKVPEDTGLDYFYTYVLQMLEKSNRHSSVPPLITAHAHDVSCWMSFPFTTGCVIFRK